MAVPTSTDWTLTGKELIRSALLKLRAIDPTQSVSPTALTDAQTTLNAMLKSWALDGIDIWLDKEVVVYMAYNAQSYLLGPTGDESSYLDDSVYTQLSADSAAADLTLTVDSITGFASADIIGVQLDNGTMHWDVVSGAPSGYTITITTGVASAASADNYVFGYTSAISRPITITEARVRRVSNDETPIRVVYDRNEFMRRTDKYSQGETQEVYYDPITVNGKLYVWPVCGTSNINDRIILSTKRTIADIDSAGIDNFDLPNEVMNAVIWNLADELQPEYGLNYQNISQRAAYHYGLMRKIYRPKGSVYLRP